MIPAQRPPNFSWVIDGVLAGCAIASQPAHYQYLRNQGIYHVFNLTEWKTPNSLLPAGLNSIHIPVEEFGPPTLEQIHRFTSFVDKARQKHEAVAVHCYWGLGRTGTMLAAYLVRSEGMLPGTAISQIRHMRPYSIETEEQEDAVVNYGAYLDHLEEASQREQSVLNKEGKLTATSEPNLPDHSGENHSP